MINKIIDTNILTLKSIGLFGSWCLYKPANALFDCGDGCAATLGYKNFSVDNIFISHSHIDHMSGLSAFIGIRNRTKGANDKPLNIYYNQRDPFLDTTIQYLRELYPEHSLKYELSFLPFHDSSVHINKKTYVKSFPVQHTKWSMGFAVCDESRKIRDGLDKEEIGRKLKNKEVNPSDVLVKCDIVKFAYLLDNCGFDWNEVRNAQLAVLDCTFLEAKDRTHMTHATYDECMEFIEKTNCKEAYLAHISPRYGDTTPIGFKREQNSNITYR